MATTQESASRRVRVALTAIVTVGLGVRLWGLAFGLPLVLARPDELFIIGIVIRRLHAGNPNPRMFDYPTLYLYLLAGVFSIYQLWALASGRIDGVAGFQRMFNARWSPFFLIGRAMSAVLGAATIVACYAVASPLFGRATGLLSALFMSLAFLHVRDSHYATTDVTMVFFIMCAMVAVVRLYRARASRDAWLAGVFAGLATGTKYNAGLIVLPILIVEVLHACTLRTDWRRFVRETHLWRAAFAFLFVFVATSPYLFLDYHTALDQLGALQESTMKGMTPREVLGRGWTYHLPFSLRHGLGLPLLLAGLGGMGLMAVRRPALAMILGSFPVAYYIVVGAGYNVFVRYMLPVVPFLCISAGYLVYELTALRASARVPHAARAAGLALLITLPSVLSVVRFDLLMSREDNRIVAASWIHEHIPAESSIYMAGNRYGHPQLPPEGRFRVFGYDARAERFTENERTTEQLPDWIVLQRSPLPYSHVPPRVIPLLKKYYSLEITLTAADLSETRNAYDIQDGFYAPYGGFRGVRRPGPNFEIYRRRY